MAARPMPVKSKSMPNPIETVETQENQEGKELTHLTKGRARGPKKRSPGKSAPKKEIASKYVAAAVPTVQQNTPIKQKSPSFRPVVPPKSTPEKPRLTEKPLGPERPQKPQKPAVITVRPTSSGSVKSLESVKQQDKSTPSPSDTKPKVIVKREPDSPPPPQSKVWNKPPLKDRPPPSMAPEKFFNASLPSTPEFQPPKPRERERTVSGSMKARLAELSPLRRDSASGALSLFGSLLRSPQAPTPTSTMKKPKYPQLEIIPAPAPSKILDKERLFVQAWSIVSRVKHVSLPNTEEHVLYSGDMHAFLYMFNDEPGASEPSTMKFLWMGRECSLGEREGMEFVRLMGDQNADTYVIRQGNETPLFMRALGGVIVTRNGTRRPLPEEENALFCVRQCLGGVSIDQVPFRRAEFCSGFSFVAKTGNGEVFAWHGNGSLSEEIAAARRFAGQLIQDGAEVRETMEADPSGCAALWKCFEEEQYASGEFWRRKYDLNGFKPVVYVVEDQKVRRLEVWTDE